MVVKHFIYRTCTDKWYSRNYLDELYVYYAKTLPAVHDMHQSDQDS